MQWFQALMQICFVLSAALLAAYYGGKLDSAVKLVKVYYHGKPGCNPLPNIGNVTLHYFELRDRAEVIRLLMEEAEIEYTDHTFSEQKWKDVKIQGIKSGLLSFGQVPALETNSGFHLVQSQVILHYLARSCGFDCDCEDLTQCELIAAGIEDARRILFELQYRTDFNTGDREHYILNIMPVWMSHFEKLAPLLHYQDKAFFASDRLTWVDFLVFDWLENNMEFARFDFGPHVKPNKNILSEYPRLNNFYQHFAGRPRIAGYRTSSKRLPYTVPIVPNQMKS